MQVQSLDLSPWTSTIKHGSQTRPGAAVERIYLKRLNMLTSDITAGTLRGSSFAVPTSSIDRDGVFKPSFALDFAICQLPLLQGFGSRSLHGFPDTVDRINLVRSNPRPRPFMSASASSTHHDTVIRG